MEQEIVRQLVHHKEIMDLVVQIQVILHTEEVVEVQELLDVLL